MEKVLKVALMLSAVDKMTSTVEKASSDSIKSLTRVQKEADRMASAAFSFGAKTGALGMAVAVPLWGMAKAAEANATAQARLDQVLNSMGETTGRVSEQAKKLASNLQFEIAVNENDILAAQAKLATFSNVIKDAEVFERSTRAAFDLQAAGFGDAAGNAVQLGKALQDPIKGMTALTRSGVTFTAEEQKKIKAMTESGNLLGAQKYLLEAVEKQVGGVAAATADDSDKMTLAFQKITEELGKALLPILKDVTNYMVNTLIPAVKDFVANNGPLIASVMKGAAVFAGLMIAISAVSFVFGGVMKAISIGIGIFKGLILVVKGVSAVMGVLNAVMLANPIGLIVVAVLALIAAFAALVYWFNDIEAWFMRQSMWVKLLMAPLLMLLAPFIALVKVIRYVIDHWDELKQAAIDRLKGILDFITSLPERMYEAGVNIVRSIWDGMKSMWNDMTDWFEGGIQKLRDFLPFSPAKRGPLRDIHRLKLVETIAQNIKPGPMVSAMEAATGGVRGAVSRMTGFDFSGGGGMAASGGGGVVVNFNPTLNVGPGGASSREDFMQMLRDFQPELMRSVEEAMRRRERTKF
jgi:uncharacterized membrane protein YgcG